MQNPAFWARLGLLWCIFIFAACWCAGAVLAASTNDSAPGHAVAAEPPAAPKPPATNSRLKVANSQAANGAPAVDGNQPRALPTLNGMSLLLLAGCLAFGAFWVWRRRQ
jgi:hypothetical protein